jgi:hypothetical protein
VSDEFELGDTDTIKNRTNVTSSGDLRSLYLVAYHLTQVSQVFQSFTKNDKPWTYIIGNGMRSTMPVKDSWRKDIFQADVSKPRFSTTCGVMLLTAL